MIFSKTRTQPFGWIMACYDATVVCNSVWIASKPADRLAIPKGSTVHGFYCKGVRTTSGIVVNEDPQKISAAAQAATSHAHAAKHGRIWLSSSVVALLDS